MWLIVLLAAVVGANPQYTKTAYSGVKGGYSGSGHNYQYNAGENQNKFFSNNTQNSQSGYGGRPSYPGYEEPGVGVCLIEVPTASLVRDPSHVPAGNGSRPDLSRIRGCCSGYIRNIHNYRLCDPVCTQECVNALCTAPNTCTCFPDHVKNAAGFCVPTCPIGCQNGQCAGGECLCKDGYRLDVDGKYCTPRCADNCGGAGNCTSPNTCTCKTGYEATPSGSCKPTCTADCRNGDCIAPNECRCKHGYSKGRSGVCEPLCSQDCGLHGHCIAPNVCSNPVTTTTTTTTPSHYIPHPYNPSNQHNPQPIPLNSNPQYPGNYSNNPYNPGSQRPYYSNQPNNQNGQHNNPNQHYYPDHSGPYYPENNRPTFTSDSQIKPNQPDSSLINHTIYYPNYPTNQTTSYESYQPNNPSNPNRPTYYPNNQPGQYPNTYQGSNPSNPNQPYYPNQQGQYPGHNQGNNPSNPNQGYPSNQYPNNNYPYDQNNEELVPRCSQPCINGVCMAGNRCACNAGYELDNSDPSGTRCNPHCAGGCQNGVCSAPNFCICNMGYRKEQGVKGGSPRCVKRMKRSAILDLLVQDYK